MPDTDLLAEAVSQLDQAVTRMFGPTLTEHGPAASLWAQMVEAVHDKPHSGNSGQWATGPAAWLDAIDWCTTIETTVRGWAGIHDDPQTILDGWCATSAWRPQDADTVAGYARALHGWCRKAERLLSGASVMSVDADCPSCGKRYIYRRNQYGETVRTAALEVTTAGCECLHCYQTWPSTQLEFLARVIGCTPVGETA